MASIADDNLLITAKNNDEAAVNHLLTEQNIDINTTDADGSPPLFHVVRGNHAAIVQLLTTNSIDINLQNNKGFSPLTISTTLRLEEIFQQMLDTGHTDLNFKCHDGRSFLSYAASEGHEGIVKLLLALPGIDVNASDPRTGHR